MMRGLVLFAGTLMLTAVCTQGRADDTPTQQVRPVPLRSLGTPRGHVEVRESIPTAQEVADRYFNPVGTPVLLRGAATHMLRQTTSVEEWTDDFLAKKYPNVIIEAEMERIETREADQKRMKLKKFVQKYHAAKRPMYSVTPIHDSKLGSEFRLPSFLACGKWLDYLQSAILWLGDFETKSVLHNDDLEGLMCLLSGTKRWYYVDKRHFKTVMSSKCGWNVADETGRGYGEFARINVDDIDPRYHECYDSLEWYHADMQPGDCLLTPASWFHQVSSKGRTLGVLFWLYSLPDFNATSADACASGHTDDRPINQLRWIGEQEELAHLEDNERWTLGWFNQYAPDHPFKEFLEGRLHGPHRHDSDEF